MGGREQGCVASGRFQRCENVRKKLLNGDGFNTFSDDLAESEVSHADPETFRFLAGVARLTR